MSKQEGLVQEKLYPMAVANYLAKLPEVAPLGQLEVNRVVVDGGGPLDSRIKRIIPSGAVLDEVMSEVEILWQTINDNEAAVQDQERAAYYRITDQNQIKHGSDKRNLEWYLRNGVVVEPEDEAIKQSGLSSHRRIADAPLVEVH